MEKMKWSEYFPSDAPESAGISSASVLELIDTMRRRSINVHSLMILRHCRAITGLWWKPYCPEQPHQLYSFSKSVAAAAAGIAAAEGKLSVNDRIAGFFPRTIGPEADERMYTVTVEHLLTMTSGATAQNEVTMRSRTDWVSWFLNTPLSHEPGQRFVYNSLNTYMLSVILRKVTGEGLVDYLMPRLFEPLGIGRPVWDTCPMGIECGGWGLYLKTEDMAKFCQLCLDDGIWGGKRLLPEGWAALAGSALAATVADGKLSNSKHRACGYGYQFWRNADGCSWRADGMFGQYGIIIPEKDMVIVLTGGHASQMEIMDVLYDVFLPHVDEIPEGSSTGPEFDELCRISENLYCARPKQSLRSLVEENRINERLFRFPVNSFSLLPLSVRYLHRVKNLGVSGLRFEFGEKQSYMCWTEGGREQCVPFRMDGQFSSGMLTYSRRQYPVVTVGAWTAPDTLEVDVRLIHTAHMNRITARFEDDRVICSLDEDPDLESMFRMVLDLARPVRPLAPRMARFAGKRVPSLIGISATDAE